MNRKARRTWTPGSRTRNPFRSSVSSRSRRSLLVSSEDSGEPPDPVDTFTPDSGLDPRYKSMVRLGCVVSSASRSIRGGSGPSSPRRWCYFTFNVRPGEKTSMNSLGPDQ